MHCAQGTRAGRGGRQGPQRPWPVEDLRSAGPAGGRLRLRGTLPMNEVDW